MLGSARFQRVPSSASCRRLRIATGKTSQASSPTSRCPQGPVRRIPPSQTLSLPHPTSSLRTPKSRDGSSTFSGADLNTHLDATHDATAPTRRVASHTHRLQSAPTPAIPERDMYHSPRLASFQRAYLGYPGRIRSGGEAVAAHFHSSSPPPPRRTPRTTLSRHLWLLATHPPTDRRIAQAWLAVLNPASVPATEVRRDRLLPR